MHRLEITGATPEELYVNSLRMLTMLVKGGAQTTPLEETAAVADTRPPEGQVFTTSSTAETAPAPAKGKRGPKAKVEPLPNDPLPESMAGPTIEHDPKEVDGKPAELTLDGDIRPMLRAIQKSCTERGMKMPECVEYIMKLYGPFGVQKADQLKPAQFVEFMEVAEGYLAGTV